MPEAMKLMIKQSATVALKTASKREIQKPAEATGDLIGKQTADKLANTSSQNTLRINTTL